MPNPILAIFISRQQSHARELLSFSPYLFSDDIKLQSPTAIDGAATTSSRVDMSFFTYSSSENPAHSPPSSSPSQATELLIQIATHGENSGFEVLCLIISATDDLDPYPLAIQDSTRASPLLLNGRIIHVEGMRPNSGALRGGNLEEETCFEFRVLAQNYTETPGHPSSNFWNHDSGRLQGYMLSSPPSHSVFVVSKFKLTRDLFSGGDSSQWIH
ncbi:hypothetical protein KFK09_011668 [Dendrobium nobile]|uniref:Uncharacterized protein n=1 Tax=Dendrobium nobile TaxID=94219 RepID=A0A8T3BFJ4_DENNO|nr:hypothetical protein KFK09_011668 [Dendrobium nobile]